MVGVKTTTSPFFPVIFFYPYASMFAQTEFSEMNFDFDWITHWIGQEWAMNSALCTRSLSPVGMLTCEKNGAIENEACKKWGRFKWPSQTESWALPTQVRWRTTCLCTCKQAPSASRCAFGRKEMSTVRALAAWGRAEPLPPTSFEPAWQRHLATHFVLPLPLSLPLSVCLLLTEWLTAFKVKEVTLDGTDVRL